MYNKKEFNYIKYNKKEYRFNLFLDRKQNLKETITFYSSCNGPIGLEYKNYNIQITNATLKAIKEI